MPPDLDMFGTTEARIRATRVRLAVRTGAPRLVDVGYAFRMSNTTTTMSKIKNNSPPPMYMRNPPLMINPSKHAG
jgi:hypothetical protein